MMLINQLSFFQTTFSDMYLGYTTTLASFLSLEFNRLNHSEKNHKTQVGITALTGFSHNVLETKNQTR